MLKKRSTENVLVIRKRFKHFCWLKIIPFIKIIYKKITTITNKNNEHHKSNSDNNDNNFEDNNKTVYTEHVKDILLNK